MGSALLKVMMQDEGAAWFCAVFQRRAGFEKVTSSCRCKDKTQVLHRASHKTGTLLPHTEGHSQLAELAG